MIIACPACSTKYVVPDTAIGVDGRTVRCAKCRHSWHQDGPELDLSNFAGAPPAPVTIEEAPPEQAPEPLEQRNADSTEATRTGFTNTHQAYGDETEHLAKGVGATSVGSTEPFGYRLNSTGNAENFPTPPPTVVEAEAEPEPEPKTFYYDETSQFDYEPPFRSRRNPLKIWTAAAVLFAVAALGTIAAGSFYGWPDWMPVSKPTFAVAQSDLVLDFPADQQDRRELPNGSEFFGASGTVTNTGRETRNVPSILIVMRDERDHQVYSWEVVPPQPTLAPGESMTVNEAVTDIPKRAKYAEIGWKPG